MQIGTQPILCMKIDGTGQYIVGKCIKLTFKNKQDAGQP